MNFITNTKPLADALDLAIVNSNVSNFHKKSTLVQVTATRTTLRINVESASICTEATINGSGDADGPVSMFVGSLLLKQLVSTFNAPTVTVEFADGGLILHSGKSKFTLPKMIDEAEIEFVAPELPEYTADVSDITKNNWKFIKDRQMYAIAMSFIHPVYTRVWVSEDGNVLVGDFDNSLFTLSSKNELPDTCLLSDTIINLFNALPDGAKLIKLGRKYLIRYECDSFSYLTQFTPMYEDDPDVGSYNSDIFLGVLEHPDQYVEVASNALIQFLNQAQLLASSSEDCITLELDGNMLALRDKNVDCKLEVTNPAESKYEVEFKTESLRKVLASYSDSDISIAPIVQDGVTAGLLVWDEDVTTMIAGVE